MTEVMVTTGAVRRAKLQSGDHHQQTNTQLSNGQMPFLSPDQHCQSTEGVQKPCLDLCCQQHKKPTYHLLSKAWNQGCLD